MKTFLTLCLSAGIFFSASTSKGQVYDPFKDVNAKTKIARDIFSSTRIINGHSVKQLYARQLEFRISHRFGPVNSGGYNFYGLDQSLVHLSLEYGIRDWLTVGAGRGNYNKTYDAYAKFLLLNQTSGEKNFPFHLTLLTSVEMKTVKPVIQTTNPWITGRMAYVEQLLLARQFNDNFSFQLTPTYIYRNLAAGQFNDRNIFALGLGAHYRIAKKMYLTAEYYLVQRNNRVAPGVEYYNPLAVGIDIVAGGHVFQIMLTNSQGMRANGFIGNTTESWGNGGIHLGFNISRTFDFY